MWFSILQLETGAFGFFHSFDYVRGQSISFFLQSFKINLFPSFSKISLIFHLFRSIFTSLYDPNRSSIVHFFKDTIIHKKFCLYTKTISISRASVVTNLFRFLNVHQLIIRSVVLYCLMYTNLSLDLLFCTF